MRVFNCIPSMSVTKECAFQSNIEVKLVSGNVKEEGVQIRGRE